MTVAACVGVRPAAFRDPNVPTWRRYKGLIDRLNERISFAELYS